MRRKSIDAELTALDEECRRLGPSVDGDVEELRQSIAELRSAGMPLGMKEQFLRLLSSLVEMAKCQREFDRLETEISATAKRLEVSEKKEKRRSWGPSSSCRPLISTPIGDGRVSC